MIRTSLAALAVSVALALPAATQSDALTDLRFALGGDAALARITSIHASGKIEVPNRVGSGHIDVYFEFPDKFVRITRLPPVMTQSTSQGRLLIRGRVADQDPVSGDRMMPDLNVDESVTTTRSGFNGDTIIRGRGAGGWKSVLGRNSHHYARFAIPLLASTTPSYRTDATSDMGTVRYAGADGMTWSLALDPATHLPSALTWTQIAAIGRQRPSAQTWTMKFSDFRKAGDVTWPYRMVMTLAGTTIEDVRIDKYEINTKISPKIFKP